MTDTDRNTIAAMIAFGGSFVRHLGEAARYADSENIARLKTAWPEYWARYETLAGQRPVRPSNKETD